MPRSRPQGHPADTAYAVAIRDSQAEQRARKAARKRERQDKAYLVWVADKPCLVCRIRCVEVHHHPSKSHEGWNDRSVAPLCSAHHRGRWGIHSLGEAGFNARYALDLAAEVARLRAEYEAEQ